MTGIPRDKREPSAPLPVVDIDDRKIVDAARPQPACAADDTRDLDHDGQITTADRKAVDALCTFPDCARNAEGTDND